MGKHHSGPTGAGTSSAEALRPAPPCEAGHGEAKTHIILTPELTPVHFVVLQLSATKTRNLQHVLQRKRGVEVVCGVGLRHGACGACGLRAGPSTSGPPSRPHRRRLSRTEKPQPQPEGSHTSIRKTQTNTRPGSWLPWGQGDTAPPQHTEPERKEVPGVAWRADGPSRETCCQRQH